jgi:hypothetical protein
LLIRELKKFKPEVIQLPTALYATYPALLKQRYFLLSEEYFTALPIAEIYCVEWLEERRMECEGFRKNILWSN